MTAAEHIAKAEQLLTQAHDPDIESWDSFATASATEAIGHALIAIAIELGAPHAGPASAVPGGS